RASDILLLIDRSANPPRGGGGPPERCGGYPLPAQEPAEDRGAHGDDSLQLRRSRLALLTLHHLLLIANPLFEPLQLWRVLRSDPRDDGISLLAACLTQVKRRVAEEPAGE